MNIVQLQGGLRSDPTLKFLDSGVAKLEFTLAVSSPRYDRKAGHQVVDTVFIACQVWGEAGERFAAEDMHQGDEIYVHGRLDQREKETTEDNVKISTRVIVMWWQIVRKRRP